MTHIRPANGTDPAPPRRPTWREHGHHQQCIVLGHLGADPTLRTTTNGTAQQAQHRHQSPIDVDDKTAFETTWRKVKLWGARASSLNTPTPWRCCCGGWPITVEEWTDTNGEAQKRTVIVGHQLTLLGGSTSRSMKRPLVFRLNTKGQTEDIVPSAFTIWCTGLPKSGKSALADALAVAVRDVAFRSS